MRSQKAISQRREMAILIRKDLMMSDTHASIYGLKDQRNQEIFYVGMSADPYARYGQHVAIRTAKDAKEARILDMREDGLMPELVIFEKDIPIGQASTRERHWIHFHLEQGIELTNIFQYVSRVDDQCVEPIYEDAQIDVHPLTDWQVKVWRTVYGDAHDTGKKGQIAKVTLGHLYSLFKLNNLLDNIQGETLDEQLVYLHAMLLVTPHVTVFKRSKRYQYQPEGYLGITAYDLQRIVFPPLAC